MFATFSQNYLNYSMNSVFSYGASTLKSGQLYLDSGFQIAESFRQSVSDMVSPITQDPLNVLKYGIKSASSYSLYGLNSVKLLLDNGFQTAESFKQILDKQNHNYFPAAVTASAVLVPGAAMIAGAWPIMAVPALLASAAALPVAHFGGQVWMSKKSEETKETKDIHVNFADLSSAYDMTSFTGSHGMTLVGAYAMSAASPLSYVFDGDNRFGQWSGICLGANNQVTLIGDRGAYLQGTLKFDQNHQLTGLDNVKIGMVRGANGNDLDKTMSDMEEIVCLKDGSYMISHEGANKISLVKGALDKPVEFKNLSVPISVQNLPKNEGIEAFAGLPGNKTIAIAETSRKSKSDTSDLTQMQQFFMFDENGNETQVGGYLSSLPQGKYNAKGDIYGVSAMTALDNGDLLIVERGYKPGPAKLWGTYENKIKYVCHQQYEQANGNSLITGKIIGSFDSDKSVIERGGQFTLASNIEGIAAQSRNDGSLDILTVVDDNREMSVRSGFYHYHIDAKEMVELQGMCAAGQYID